MYNFWSLIFEDYPLPHESSRYIASSSFSHFLMETKFAHLFLNEKTLVKFLHNYVLDFPHIVLSNVAETG